MKLHNGRTLKKQTYGGAEKLLNDSSEDVASTTGERERQKYKLLWWTAAELHTTMV